MGNCTLERTIMADSLEKLCFLAELADAMSSDSSDDEENGARQEWVKPWLLARDDPSKTTLYQEIEQDCKKFRECFRMSPEVFDHLLHKLEPSIRKQETHMRMSISPKIRLQLTLRYLTSGANFCVLEELFRVSKASISLIIPEVCDAIWKELGPQCIQCPMTPVSLLRSLQSFV